MIKISIGNNKRNAFENYSVAIANENLDADRLIALASPSQRSTKRGAWSDKWRSHLALVTTIIIPAQLIRIVHSDRGCCILLFSTCV